MPGAPPQQLGRIQSGAEHVFLQCIPLLDDLCRILTPSKLLNVAPANEPTLIPIPSKISVRQGPVLVAVSAVLQGLLEASYYKNTLSSTDAENALEAALLSSSRTLFYMGAPDSTSFTQVLVSTDDLRSESASEGVLRDFVLSCGHFGKFSALIMSRRWTGLKCALTVMASSAALPTLFKAASFGEEMLTFATDQMSVADPTTVADIIACASMAVSVVFSPWHPRDGGTSAVLHASNDTAKDAEEEVDKVLDRRRQLVRDFLAIAWKAILGEEDLGLTSLQEFIRCISNPSLSHTMDCETILVRDAFLDSALTYYNIFL